MVHDVLRLIKENERESLGLNEGELPQPVNSKCDKQSGAKGFSNH